MLIERTDPFTGKKNALELPITEDQLATWKRGMVIQRAMPHLTPDQREFLMTGIMPDSWDAAFKDSID